MLCPGIRNINKALWLVLAAVLVTVTAVPAQQPVCGIKYDQSPDAPELFGFRLGMTFEQVKARVPHVQFGRADQFGVTKTSINPHFDPRFDQAGFVDVRTISLDFLDGKLVSLWIGYESTFKWQTLDEFVEGISKSLSLQAEWPTKRGGRQLACDGFSIFASVIAGSPSVRLTDESAQATIANRREEAAAAAEAVEAAVIGDRRTKLYYQADCSAPQSLPEASRVTFKDKEEAEKAGFKLAKDCQ